MKLIIMLLTYPVGVAIGASIGCLLYYNSVNMKRKIKIKRKIRKNKSEGKETCPSCHSGVSFETKSIGIRESLKENNSDEFKAIAKCYYCGCDHAIMVHKDKFQFI